MRIDVLFPACGGDVLLPACGEKVPLTLSEAKRKGRMRGASPGGSRHPFDSSSLRLESLTTGCLAASRGEGLRTFFLLLLLAACAQNHVDRARWMEMPAQQKRIYVRSMIGHEEAKASKGGNERRFTLPPDEYVRRIDAAYARGDRRDPDTIFEEMGSPR